MNIIFYIITVFVCVGISLALGMSETGALFGTIVGGGVFILLTIDDSTKGRSNE